MKTKFFQTTIPVVIFSLMLVLTWNGAKALQTYSASHVFEIGEGKNYKLVNEPNATVKLKVKPGSIDDYLIEHELEEVELWVEMTEELVECEEDTHYRLDFTFGQSGVYFDPPLEVTLKGKYLDTDCEVWFYDEFGEPLEGDVSQGGNKIKVYIPHFSSYAYDHYDY